MCRYGGGVYSLNPTEPSICSAINLPPSPCLCSFTHPAIYPFSPMTKGPCLFVALIIWSNFLCNLFPGQPPTWSSSIRLLKVEPLIPASPFPPITSCFFSCLSLRSFGFCVVFLQVSVPHWSNATFPSFPYCNL